MLLQRAVYDPQHNIPAVDVGIDVPSVKTSLSEAEYSLITSMAGENFSEMQRMPQAARWLQRWAGSAEGLSSRNVLCGLYSSCKGCWCVWQAQVSCLSPSGLLWTTQRAPGRAVAAQHKVAEKDSWMGACL